MPGAQQEKGGICSPGRRGLITRAEAVAILEAVRDGESVSAVRAREFARAVLELAPVGRLALTVLDGGLFVSTRLVELTEAFLSTELADDESAADEVGS